MVNARTFSMLDYRPTASEIEGAMDRQRRTYIVDFFHGDVGLGRQAEIFRFGVDDNQNGVGMVLSHQFIDGDIIAMQFGTCVIPADDTFTS